MNRFEEDGMIEKSGKTIWVVVMIVWLNVLPALGLTEFKDGGTHDIAYEISDDVWIDSQAPGMQTVVNWLDGAVLTNGYNLQTYEESRVNMYGGTIGNNLQSFDNSRADVFGGHIGWVLEAYEYSEINISDVTTVGHLGAFGNSYISISGGNVGTHLLGYDHSEVHVSGGSIGAKIIAGYESVDDSSIFLAGTNFAVDGQPIGYGVLGSVNGGFWNNEPIRRLTGTLLNGDTLDNEFYIGGGASIVLVPEPTTVLLLGLGSLAMVRRRRSQATWG